MDCRTSEAELWRCFTKIYLNWKKAKAPPPQVKQSANLDRHAEKPQTSGPYSALSLMKKDLNACANSLSIEKVVYYCIQGDGKRGNNCVSCGYAQKMLCVFCKASVPASSKIQWVSFHEQKHNCFFLPRSCMNKAIHPFYTWVIMCMHIQRHLQRCNSFPSSLSGLFDSVPY